MLQYTLRITNAVLYTIRPSATFGACFLVLGAFNPGRDDVHLVIPLMICTFFGSAFCFLVNDIYDREKDLLNEKFRPIATGIISLQLATILSVLFALIFLTSSYFLGTTVFILSFLFLALSTIYSYVNHTSGFLANIIVALIVSGTQWGVAILKPDSFLLFSSLFLFFITIPRELLLDWLDKKGDEATGKHSIPIQHSVKRLTRLILIILLLSTSALLVGMLLLPLMTVPFLFIALTIISAWLAFWKFLWESNDKHALLSARISHITFAFLIVALLTR